MTPPELALVVPCYNEAARLEPPAFLSHVAARPRRGCCSSTMGAPTRRGGDRADAARRPTRSRRSVCLRAPGRRGRADRMLEVIRTNAPLAGFLDADLSTPLSVVDDVLAAAAGTTRRRVRARLTREADGAGHPAQGGPALPSGACSPPRSRSRSTCRFTIRSAGEGAARHRGDRVAVAAPFRSRWIFDVELIAPVPAPAGRPGEPRRRDRSTSSGARVARQAGIQAAGIDLAIGRRRSRPDMARSAGGSAPAPTARNDGYHESATSPRSTRAPRRVRAQRRGHSRPASGGVRDHPAARRSAWRRSAPMTLEKKPAPSSRAARSRRPWPPRPGSRSCRVTYLGGTGFQASQRHRQRRDRRLAHGMAPRTSKRGEDRQHRRAVRLRRERGPPRRRSRAGRYSSASKAVSTRTTA